MLQAALVQAAPSALPASETQRIVSALLDVLDGDSPAQALRDIARYREAGFVYQPALAVSEETCPTENEDQRAVLSGMIAADRGFAFFFGKPEDALRENRQLQSLWQQKLPSPSKEELRTLRDKPQSERARAIAEKYRKQEYAAFVRAAARDEHLLRLLGAHIYGVYIERLYMTSVMVLAAAESDELEPLFLVHENLAAHHGKALELLGKEGMLGSGEENARRAELAKRLQGLLTADKGRPTLDGLREIVTLTQEERTVYLTPCPLP
ncbi:hypothetical protein [uncultured Desulfovibrio sp.]|uniref:hypothetical protein n=1 Tax=uncultured Desulfovibrio sp. TaxID=167968 RepID=UPI00263973CE|nr:hypothetical protein [uncultured Desulfovibrio sp.]